jgi:hypothetical protein
MYVKATAQFTEGAGGEEATVIAEVLPGDAHQHDLLSKLILKGGDMERVGGRFVITLKLGVPNPNYAPKPVNTQQVAEPDGDE